MSSSHSRNCPQHCSCYDALLQENQSLRHLNYLLIERIKQLEGSPMGSTRSIPNLNENQVSLSESKMFLRELREIIAHLEDENQKLRELNVSLQIRIMDLENEVTKLKQRMQKLEKKEQESENQLRLIQTSIDKTQFMYFISDCIKEFHGFLFETNPKFKNGRKYFFQRLNETKAKVNAEIYKEEEIDLDENRLDHLNKLKQYENFTHIFNFYVANGFNEKDFFKFSDVREARGSRSHQKLLIDGPGLTKVLNEELFNKFESYLTNKIIKLCASASDQNELEESLAQIKLIKKVRQTLATKASSKSDTSVNANCITNFLYL